jgi:hypothetical protein
MTRATSPAARAEDYPLEYLEFEGTIPEGSYRADEVRVWSAGRRVRRVPRAQGPRRAARGSEWRAIRALRGAGRLADPRMDRHRAAADARAHRPDFHGKGEFGHDVAIQPDGKIVAAGFTTNGIDTEFALMRINP